MNPILYAPGTRDFGNNGIGILPDCTRCIVNEEVNGGYELELDYQMDGLHYPEIVADAYIKAKPNEISNQQIFHVYKVLKNINGGITAYAEHISYQLANITVSPFAAGSAAAALQGLVDHSTTANPFGVWTDVTRAGSFAVTEPASFRSRLGGVQGSVLDAYHGEYEWDNYTVKLHAQRGRDSGVNILYGKNLVDLQQEENIASVVTGVHPYYKDNDGNVMELPEKVVKSTTPYAYDHIVPLDMSQDFDEQPTEAQMRAAAVAYINQTGIDKPAVSLSIDFVPIWQTADYKDDPIYKQVAGLERLGMCDTATVRFERLGVDAKAKVVRYTYDVLKERYERMELGDARSNLADTISGQQQDISQKPTQSMLETAIASATAAITGASGGHYMTYPQKHPQEWRIMDTQDAATAKKVLRGNIAGIGGSENGVNGPYKLAILLDGTINASAITTGILTANIIKAGVLASLNGQMSIDMETGIIYTESGDYNSKMWSGQMLLQKRGKDTVSIYSVGENYDYGRVAVSKGNGIVGAELLGDTVNAGRVCVGSDNDWSEVLHKANGKTWIAINGINGYEVELIEVPRAGGGTALVWGVKA